MYADLISNLLTEPIENIKEEIRINCIYQDCPNPYKHLYFNTTKGVGFCHRCNRVSTIRSLVCHHKGVSLADAEAFILGTGQQRAESLVSQMKKLQSSVIKTQEEELDVEISLPEGFTAFSSGEYKFSYLDKRGITYDEAITYGMGFCTEGRWKDRLIVPIYLHGVLRGFVGRSVIDPPEYLSKQGKKIWSRINRYIKVLNPKGFNSSRLLFNYDQITDEIIITEGIFDALRCGPKAVALFGKHLSSFQENLIRKKKLKKLYVMLDSDAHDDAEDMCHRFAATGLEVYLVRLPHGDPGSFPRKQLNYYIKSSKRVSPLKFFFLMEKFNDVYK
mgnify:FL=1